MDEPTYNQVKKVYDLFKEKEDKITDKEVSYILGILESVLEFNKPVVEGAEERKGFFGKLGG